MQIVDPRTGSPMTPPDNSSQRQSGAAPSVDDSQIIVDVDMSNFQQVVLEGSLSTPVLLASWGPSSEESRNLSPVLEKLAREYAGAFVLARFNAEENTQIAAQLGIRSVPDVKLIMQGQLYDHFQGALPERQIREWLGRYLEAPESTGESTEEQAKAALEAGDTAKAKALYQQLIEEQPNDHEYRIDLANVLAAENDREQALEILDNLPPEHRDGHRARGVRARLDFVQEAPSAEEVEALGDRDDSEARFKRAMRTIADGDYESGLEQLIELMKRDRSYNDDAPRKTLLRVFDALGNDHPLTVTYRRRMFTLLY
ncbi:tetratricopeptide repeat protein [Kushneria phosphatilytica]|uniref:Tetratricopeptide repeat protein n=1 Tax=Kushneria phosphatilytica TaxID=657387 RepID=A0A1S1NXD1_9GAMM|nr:tetratricopeptide repeat protein [Kushneria phosphatilytica]OHV10858.1 co-chaperone YbbN [Kushneria phosphatilytica]QEL12058.1 tetratricopeptide repeat protein [Kushneria phosphatilytica]